MQTPHTVPLDVEAVAGEVLISGRCGIAVSLAPEAAAETSSRLLAAAARAKRQVLHTECPRSV